MTVDTEANFLAQTEGNTGNTFFIKARGFPGNFLNFIFNSLLSPFFTAIAYKQNRIVAINENQTRISCLQVEEAGSSMLCTVDCIFN